MNRPLFAGMLAAIAIAGVSLQTGCKKDNPVVVDTYCDSLMIKSPNGGEALRVGQTVNIQWCYPKDFPYGQVVLHLTKNGGRTWGDPLNATPIAVPTASFSWVVADTQVGTQCLIQVSDYNNNVKDYSDAFFTITP